VSTIVVPRALAGTPNADFVRHSSAGRQGGSEHRSASSCDVRSYVVSEYVAVLSAGFEGAEAARIYRALADFALSSAGGEAGFLSLDAHSQEADRAAWTRAYRAVEQTEHPRIWQVWEEPPNVRDDEIFEAILSLVAGGLARQAPGPCGCGAHVPMSARA
jgi:hypothetical protein